MHALMGQAISSHAKRWDRSPGLSWTGHQSGAPWAAAEGRRWLGGQLYMVISARDMNRNETEVYARHEKENS